MLKNHIIRHRMIAPSAITTAIIGLFSVLPASAQTYAETNIVIDSGGYTQTVPTTSQSSVIYYNNQPSIAFPQSNLIARPNYAGGSRRYYNRYHYPQVRRRIIRNYRSTPVYIYPGVRRNTTIKPIIINDSWHRRVRFRGNSRVIIVPSK